MSCTFCWDDLDSNLCYYKTSGGGEWKPSGWCVDCILLMIRSQMQGWIEGVKNATCPKELQRLIDMGPPIWLYDRQTYPVGEEEHVEEFKHGETVFSAKLSGAVEGVEREKLWDEMRAVMYIKAQEMNKKK